MKSGFSLGDLADRVGGRVAGDREREIEGVASLARAGPTELAFLTNPRYRRDAETTRAGAVLVGRGVALAGPDLLEVPEPYVALARILELFEEKLPRHAGVSPLACLGKGVVLGAEVEIGPFALLEEGVVVGDRATIGPGCVLGTRSIVGEETALLPRVVLYPETRVGARCRIHSGVVLGSDGFGFATSSGKHHKVPQLGRVVVCDDVEIGANTTIDRGTVGDTVVGKGTKIDNLVMVAHGVEIGGDSLLVAQSGIAGSARLGRGVTLAAQSGIAGHLTVGEGAVVAAKSAVFQDLAEGDVVAGSPAMPLPTWRRSAVLLKRLPELLAELRSLRKRVEDLERAARRGSP